MSNLIYFRFLVSLRNSGYTNMWGAVHYLMEAFGLPKQDAKDILIDWTQTFKQPITEQPMDGRYSDEEYNRLILEHASKALKLDDVEQMKSGDSIIE